MDLIKLQELAAKKELLGQHDNISSDDYHAGPGFSRSDLINVLKSPAHYQEALRHKGVQNAAMQFGTMAHTAVLEPENFNDNFVNAPIDAPQKRSKVDKAWWAAFEKDNEGKIIVKHEEMETLSAMVDKVWSHPIASKLLKGQKEQSLYWEEGGFLCKCRPDVISEDGYVVDFKTALDARPDAFSREMGNRGYDIQAAWYLDGCKKAVPNMEIKGFAFVVIEKTAPFGIKTYVPSPITLDKGRQLYKQALDSLSECSITDEWTGYPPAMEVIESTAWRLSE